jgi:hypothetical protein
MVDEIDLTLVTDYQGDEEDATFFALYRAGMPGFKLKSEISNVDDATLVHRVYVRV